MNFLPTRNCTLILHKIAFISKRKGVANIYIFANSKALTLSWRRFLLYRNRSIDLFYRSIYWFLYNRDLRHERFKTVFIYEHVLFCFFFYLIFLSWIFTREISLYPFYHLHPLHRHLDISLVVATESSPLCKAGSRNQTWNLWYTVFIIHLFYTCTGSCCC